MNEDFDIITFLKKLDFIDLERNIKSVDRAKLVRDYFDLFPFIRKDHVFMDFLQNINGLQASSTNFFVILYGFGFPEGELIFSLPQYMNAKGFLMLGEYVDNSVVRNWKGIVYAYHKIDKSPVVYAKFDRKDMPEIKERYYPLCIGFQELIEIIFDKSFDEQFRMAYTSEL